MKWSRLSIRIKLIMVFLFNTLIILLINLFLYANINSMTGRINAVYQSNSRLNELSETLFQVQFSMTEYLSVKSSDTLDAYYMDYERLTAQMEHLNTDICGNKMLMMERNIYYMTEKYLQVADEAVTAKRGRNVERYSRRYEEAGEKYDHIRAMIYSLNNLRFQTNTDSYLVLMDSLRWFEAVSVVILIVTGIVNALLIYMLTTSIIGPLTGLARAANRVADGDLDVERIPVHSRDEVGIVTIAFNQMLESLRINLERTRRDMEREAEMKEKALKMEGHLKDAQLKYLQAQINPHFLFNTLNAGAQLAMMEGADRTCLFVENMADFFRYNVKKINQATTIREELELVDSYLYILNVRFGGEIHFKKEVEEELLPVQVPSMILQPIVENAATYGIRGIDWEGWIYLSVYRDKSCICISIRDNGIGMSQEKIREILEGRVHKDDSARDSTGIGLGNVISRLQLYYNIEEVFEIRSEGENQGTEVLLYLPWFAEDGE